MLGTVGPPELASLPTYLSSRYVLTGIGLVTSGGRGRGGEGREGENFKSSLLTLPWFPWESVVGWSLA